MRWAEIYTFSVVPEVASARREELLSDLHEQYAAGAESGLSQKAVSRSILWRALRGMPADLRWGSAHHYRKGKILNTAAESHRSGNLFRGMNILWMVLIAAFVIGLGATIAGYFTRDDILGHVYFDNLGFGVAGLLVLMSMVVFIIARVLQLIGQRWSSRRHPDL